MIKYKLLGSWRSKPEQEIMVWVLWDDQDAIEVPEIMRDARNALDRDANFSDLRIMREATAEVEIR